MDSSIKEPINSEQNEIASYENTVDETNSPRKNEHFTTPSNKTQSSQNDAEQQNQLSSKKVGYNNNNTNKNYYNNATNYNNNNNNNDKLTSQNECENEQEQDSSISVKTFKHSLIYLVILGLCLVYIFQDIFTRQEFAESASAFIVDIQEWHANKTFLYTLSIIVSNSSFVVTGLIVAAVVWWGTNRIHTFNYIISFAFAASLLSTLKLLYNDPRPYMEFSDVVGEECSAEYGNPSGHAMLNLFAAAYGISVLGNQFYRRYWWVCALIGIFLIWVGFTRIHLGMHGVNQVLLGWVYASSLFLLFRVLLFQRVNSFLMNISQLPQSRVMKASILVIGVYVTHSLMLMGIFFGVKDTYEDSNDQYNPIIESACDVSNIYSISNKYLYNKCFIDAGISGGAFGLLFGIIYTQGTIKNCQNYGKFHSQLTFFTQFKRIFLIILIPGTIFGISSLVFHFVDASTIFWRYFFQLNIIPFICAFIVINVSPKLLHKFSLEIEGDFLKIGYDQSSSSSSSSTEKVSSLNAQKQILQFNTTPIAIPL